MSKDSVSSALPCPAGTGVSGFAAPQWVVQWFWVVGLTALLLLGKTLPAAKFFHSPADYVAVHSVLEFVSMTISAMVFVIGWNLARHENNRESVVLGSGFLAVCLIDLAHTLSYAGMPDLVTPSGPEKAINFWLAGRYVAAATLLAAIWVRPGTWSRAAVWGLSAAALALAGTVWWVGIEAAAWVPHTFVPGQGLTPFKLRAEYVLATLYGGAAVLLYRRRGRSEYGDVQWLAAAAWVQGLAELFFTLYADVTDVFNLLGHVYKTIAYLMVYRALFVVWAQAPYRELEFERSRLKALVTNIPDLVWLKDPQGVYLSCNAAFERLFGKEEAKIVGRTDFDFVDAPQARFFRDNDLRAIEAGGPRTNEEWLSFADGGYRGLFETTKTPIYGADGAVMGVLGIAHDITARKETEDALRVAATAFESQEGIFVTDVAHVIIRVNRAFSEITGYGAEEAVGRTPRMLRSGRHDPAFYAAMMEALEKTGVWQGEVWNRRKNGEIFPEWQSITTVRDAAGNVINYVATMIDISQRKRAEEEINHLAFYDPLTQLPNRRLLLDRLRQWQDVTARSERYGALLLIDLDNFKTLNDAHGHHVGDVLLQEVAQRLERCAREGDTVARFGGDEFVVLLTSLSRDEDEAAAATEVVGNQVLTALNATFALGAHEHRSSASIGATLFRGGSVSVEDLLRQADLAMYKSKEVGRNALCFFDPEMQTRVLKRATLEAAMRKALVEEQFYLHYQPQVLAGGRVTGAEVLVRWAHPQRGPVSPADFIPLAEETGLIVPLGDWVLETACRQLQAWAARPELAALTIAVNVSAKQIREPDFVERVRAALLRTGADPTRLKLELTESLFVENVQDIIAKMHALKEYGVGFSLDDFGTGYSSLSYLKRLPLDQLKIDQSFVRDVLDDPNDAAIARTVVALAEALGLGVIAEGVETEAQREFLAGNGCHAYQGYLFSRPLPVEQFEVFARAPQALH